MKKYIILFSLLCFYFISLQAKNKISGQFTTEKGVAIEFLQIIASQSDSIIEGVLTDQNGKFELELPSGSYILSASLFGEILYEKEWIFSQSKDIGILQVTPAISLETIVVEGRKNIIERKLDRLVFNVENTLSASGGDATDVLNATPGIKLQGDQIIMIGKSSLGLLVDNRMIQASGEDLTAFLNSISSDDIKSIEVITNPPAKYEAEGNSGLINIILKKVKQNSWNNTIRTSYIQNTYPVYAIGNSFAYNKNKTRLLFSLNARTGHQATIEQAQILYPNKTWTSKTDRKDKKERLSGRFSLDYQLNDNAVLGMQYLGGINNPDITDKNNVDVFNLSNSLDSTISSTGRNDRNTDHHSLNLHYHTQLDTLGKRMAVDLDYFRYTTAQNRIFQSQSYLPSNEAGSSFLAAINNSQQQINNYSAKIDIEHPTKWFDLSYGAKISFIDNNNFVDFHNTSTGEALFDPSQSNTFEYSENTQALYFDLTKEINKKWLTQIGLRVENTQTTGISKTLNQTNKNNYTRLFPSFYLEYIANDNNDFALSYGKRIKRPSYSELNPFRWYLSQFSYAEGNPFLEPSFTHNFEIAHIYKGVFSSSFFLSKVENGFGQVPTVNSTTNEQVFTRKNYYTEYRYGLVEAYAFRKFSWWQSNNQAYFFYAKSAFSNPTVDTPEQNGWTAYLASKNSFVLNTAKTIQASVNFWYNFPSKSRLYETDASYSLDLGLRFMLLNKDLHISINANDIFKTSVADARTFTNGIQQTYNIYNDNRHLVLTIKYRFGNKKINVRNRNFGNEEEKRRATN